MTGRFRFAVALAIVATLMMGYVAQALALNPKGKPAGMKAGQVHRYFVWHDKNGWHVRTTTAQRKHRFEGSIRVKGGKFTSVTGAKLEEKRDDWWKLGKASKMLTFDVGTDRGLDGFDFTVNAKADEIEFKMKVDDEEHADWIYIGADDEHPEGATFSLAAHPE